MKKAIMIIFLLAGIFCMYGMAYAAEDESDAPVFPNVYEHEDSRYYTVNDFYNMESEGGLHIISHYETVQQTTKYSCGSVAALMALNYYGIDGYDESSICELVGTTPQYGTTFEGALDFLEGLGLQLEYHADTETMFANLKEFEEYLIEAIDSGAPMLVEWEDWYGHWTTIIGIDTCETDDFFDDVLILADSMDVTDHCQDGYNVFPLTRFFCMWRETQFVDREVPYEQPFIKVYGLLQTNTTE